MVSVKNAGIVPAANPEKRATGLFFVMCSTIRYVTRTSRLASIFGMIFSASVVPINQAKGASR